MIKLDNLGPLPDATDEMALERQSIAALQALLPHKELVLRDERITDFGVDGSLEVLAAGKATNFRAQIQMKARSDLAVNKDASVSISIPVSNINYLLSGPCPIYVAFRPEFNEFRYVFARDEIQKIEKDTPDWKAQSSLTFRFSRVIDQNGLSEIRDKIISEGRFHRRIHDILTPLAAATSIRMQVDPAKLTVRSSAEAQRLLLSSGLYLVSAGFVRQVLDAASLLAPADYRAQPKLFLVRGFAEFTNRNYFRADPSLREALGHRDKLQSDDQCFLEFLVTAVDCALGHISHQAFIERLQEWRDRAPRHLARQFDIIRYWQERLEQTTEAARAEVDVNLRKVIDAVISDADSPTSMRQYAEVLKFSLDAQERVASLVHVLSFSRDPIIWRYAYDAHPDAVIKNEMRKLREWSESRTKLIEDIAGTANMSLYCEALFARDLCDVMIVTQLRLVQEFTGGTPDAFPEPLLAQVQRTKALAASQDQVEFELRAMVVESYLEDLRGNTEKSDALARAVLERAKIFRFAEVERVATTTLSGRGRLSRRLAEIRELRANGLNHYFANCTDAELQENSVDTCRLLRISEDRADVVLDSVKREREVAQQRFSWCRHLTVLEDSTHATDPRTLFLRRPECICRCTKLGHQSVLPTQDWRALINAFKINYCSGCTGKEPMEKRSV